jgi:hypothetical protein
MSQEPVPITVEDEWITLGDAARELGVQLWRVDRVFGQERLPSPARLGRYRIIKRSCIADVRMILDAMTSANWGEKGTGMKAVHRPPSKQNDILTPGQVAEMFGVQSWRVRRLFEQEELPQVRILGRERAIPVSFLPEIRQLLIKHNWLKETSNGRADGA